MTENLDVDIQFYQLVLSLQAQAWQSLGKVASPLTGKIERSMEQAKFSIDMLEMFLRKTKGNLTDEEKKLLEHALYELRLNYVDELNKEADSTKKGDTNGENKENEPPGPDESSEQKDS